jgi:hypothetical protein
MTIKGYAYQFSGNQPPDEPVAPDELVALV